jgi:hypothetical protein
MNIRISTKLALVSCALVAIFGCGGGGGGGGPLPVTPGTPGPTGTPGTPTAALKVSVAGTLPASTLIGGVDVTINLPAGVTCGAAADGTTATGVVTASGAADKVASVGKFTAASGAFPGQLRINAINASGFNVGEFATANVNFTGSAPAASSFTLVGAPVVVDLNGNPISGLTIQFN